MPETFGAKYAGGGAACVQGASLDRAPERGFCHPDDHGQSSGPRWRPGETRLPAEPIDVVANFADDRLFQPIPAAPIRRARQFVFHGTILERYGLRTLVEAVAQVRRKVLECA